MKAKTKQAGTTKPANGVPPARSGSGGPGKVRAEYDLSRSAFARVLGVPDSTLARRERGGEKPDAAGRARLQKAGKVLKGLTRVMRKGFIPTWLASPNDACKEAGAGTPLDLLERGDYDTVEQMIYFFEAGEPF